ncbi:UNVERIFIED_CONTAM: hypothetical protein Sangu_1612200 [Sesamum angustifolium]|uniref:PGG domain-containing protein n=1 Tax=Sesamum angustifolium TaxID=2727405 RepID=A0AAW2MH86_9LAMI
MRLYDAAARGDTRSLQELLEQDPLLLDRVSYTCPNKTPLHVATLQGYLAFVQEILNRNPQLSEELDLQQYSALHIASAKGYVEIARKLLSAAPDMCLFRDCQGRNPLHLAAMKGHVQVLAELIRKVPLAAGEKLDRGLSLLHLCVKYCQLEALKMLVSSMNELLNSKDDRGDTILHMAVRDKQIEIIQYLVGSTSIDINAKNSDGQTVIDILEQNPTDATNLEIRRILRPKLCNSSSTKIQQPEKWLTKKRDAIMVVAILIATMAFQAGVTPAGGVWQEDLIQDSNGNPVTNPHWAGEAIMARNHPKYYKSFMRANTVAFVSSLSTILLLISGLPFRRKLFLWILMIIMWLTITSIAVTYAISALVVTPKKNKKSLSHDIEISVTVWCCVMGILLVGNTVRLIDRWLKNKGIIVWRPRRFRNPSEINQGTLIPGPMEKSAVQIGGCKSKLNSSQKFYKSGEFEDPCALNATREKEMELLSLLDHDKQEDHQKHQIQQKELQEAAIQGSVPSLSQLIQENPQLLRSSIYSMPENPLHTAALLGHLEFTKQLLDINPGLSKSVNPKGSSALHLASAKGHVNIVKELVSADSSMCFKLDGDGRSPLHLAAIKGRTVVLEELLRAEPEAAAVLTGGGESCLHLCVKYNRLEAMKVFLHCLQRDDRFVDWKDQDGNTVLHLAVAKKQIEIVRYVRENTRIETDARNANGLTALDLLLQSPGDLRDLEIKQCLDQGSASRTERNESMALKADISKTFRTLPSKQTTLPSNIPKKHKHTDWLARKRNALMIVASLLATVAFQAGLSPPGGVWQDDFSGNPNSTSGSDKPHKAGQSVMAYTLPSKYGQYMIFNTIAFLASLSIILLQVSGLPMRRRRWMWTQMVTMWIAVTAQTLTYFVTLINMTPKRVERTVYNVAKISVLVWLALVGFVFIGNITRAILYVLRTYGYIEEKEREPHVSREDEEDDVL